MDLIPYDEFALLRMHDFWPTSCYIDTFECYDCLIGYADGDVYGYAYFVKNPKASDEVAEIRLESLGSQTCPEDAADRLFARINLPLAAGMSLDDVVAQLGAPIETTHPDEDSTYAIFICGEQWLYYVFCIVWRDRGLDHVMIVRKDLRDRRLAGNEGDDDDQ